MKFFKKTTPAKIVGIKFAKIIPSGNPTILLFEDKKAKNSLPALAPEIMQSNHLQAEQVGYLQFETTPPHLHMMGNEFCINATRSAVALIAHLGKRIAFDSSLQHGTVDITVSGYPSVITSILALDENALLQKLSTSEQILPQYKKRTKEKSFTQLQPYVGESKLYVASCIELLDISVEKLDQGIFLVKLPGITHLLLDKALHNLPQDWQAESKQWRSRYMLGKEVATGVIWFESRKNDYSITPSVFVSQVQSEHMETACGSGSLALALLLRKFEEKYGVIKIVQPSGETLSVLFTSESAAWVVGSVFIAATGITYVSKK